MKNGRTYTMGLCQDRHRFPVHEGIFPHHVEVKEATTLERYANERIPEDCDTLEVYVSGLTVAMLAVVKVCAARGIHLVAYHWNERYRLYTKQTVL